MSVFEMKRENLSRGLGSVYLRFGVRIRFVLIRDIKEMSRCPGLTKKRSDIFQMVNSIK